MIRIQLCAYWNAAAALTLPLAPTCPPPPANVCGSPYLAAGTCWASCWAGRQLMLRSLTLKAKMLWFTHTHTHTQIQQWRNCICGAWHAFYVPLRAARGVALASLNQLTNKYLAASCHSKGRGWGRAEGGRRNVGKSKATLWPCRIQRLIPYGRSAQAY